MRDVKDFVFNEEVNKPKSTKLSKLNKIDEMNIADAVKAAQEIYFYIFK